MIDVKFRLRRVIEDPHFSRRERQLARSSLEHIEGLEGREAHHWTEEARLALLREVRNRVLDKQGAVKIDSFLKRHRIRRTS
jgi:hypothetical protein